MSDSNKHTGFSFQISETPPPVKANDGTPLADLDLDLGDFGAAAEPSPLPVSVRAAPDISAWVDEPAAPPPAPVQATTPSATEKLRDESVHGSGLEAKLDSKPETKSHRKSEVEPESLPETKLSSELAQQTQTAEKQPTKVAPEVAPEPPQVSTPRIKKIQFPVANAQSLEGKKSAAAKKLVSQTKFSKSISAKGPRPALDSEPEIDEERVDPSLTAPPAQMAPPEDLPGAEAPLEPQASTGEGNWGSDTPSAREIWQKARTTWGVASRQAVKLGGQGMRASKALAESMNDKVRTRLREAAEERHQRADEAAITSEEASANSPTPGPGPSVAGHVILGLARSTGRKMAAPVSAAAAAALVYFAGSHLLGADGTVALSKAVKGPEIPELGTLDEGEPDQGKEDPAPEAGSNPESKASKKKTGPQPMQTEVTEMPDGLSWPGKGLIEVVTSGEELVYVDGVFTGRGPLRRIPVSPGEHEVSIRSEGSERTGTVEVKADKNTRAVFQGE